MARSHSKEGENLLEQKSNRQRTMEGADGGWYPAVDGQRLGERLSLHPTYFQQLHIPITGAYWEFVQQLNCKRREKQNRNKTYIQWAITLDNNIERCIFSSLCVWMRARVCACACVCLLQSAQCAMNCPQHASSHAKGAMCESHIKLGQMVWGDCSAQRFEKLSEYGWTTATLYWLPEGKKDSWKWMADVPLFQFGNILCSTRQTLVLLQGQPWGNRKSVRAMMPPWAVTGKMEINIFYF